MIAGDRTPRGGQQKVDRSVAVDVPHTCCVEAEGLTVDLARVLLEQLAGLAGVEIRLAAGRRAVPLLPGANDQVVVAVAVNVACVGRTDAEAIARALTGQGQEPLAG